MKLYYVVIMLVILGSMSVAQKNRYLISPNQEVIPLGKEESARLAMEMRQKRNTITHTNSCNATIYNEFIPDWGWWWPSARLGGYHKDVFAQWYVAKYTGTIDTLFWDTTYDPIGAMDSTVFVRIDRSNITPANGPGIRPGPWNPPCQPWGYWRNSNDQDRGIAPFFDEATDTTWISTIGGSTSSRPPMGEELWGLGGYPVKLRPSTSVALALSDLMPLYVTEGDVFFISMRINGPASHINDTPTRFYAGELDTRLSEFQEYYPSRYWKFYEHETSITCAGIPKNNFPPGWVARGGFTSDTLIVPWILWWYAVSTHENVPPTLVSSNTIHNTFSIAPQLVSCEIEDCDYANPAQAGVASAYIRYTISSDITGVSSTGEIPMANTGGNTWEAQIPGQPAWTAVTYTAVATDNVGLTSFFPQPSYRICGEENVFAKPIKSGSEFNFNLTHGCTPKDIQSTGVEIPSSTFFKAATQSDSINPKDDGTAGPFALSSTFWWYGEPFNYVWVGVNGAIALSKTATDTNDVNANGSFSSGWTIPGLIRTSLRDTGGTGRKPKYLIAPMWGDLFYGNKFPVNNQYGHIYYQDDECEFTVQWGPGIGVFADYGGSFIDDSVKFRVILNRCTGTITFQYDNLGSSGLDTLSCLTGFSADTLTEFNTAPWLFLSKDGYPADYAPKNGRCITIYQKGILKVSDKWNLVSVPVIPLHIDNNDYGTDRIFPTSTTLAFRYQAGYTPTDILDNGSAFWLKFRDQQIVGITGTLLLSLSIPVAAGWNLIGSISCPVAIADITCPQVAGSSWFGFNSGYNPVWPTIIPGKGNWVKASAAGVINLECSSEPMLKADPNYSQLNGFNTFTVRDLKGGNQTLYLGDASLLKVPIDRYELPPVPPSEYFDARFTSGRSVETYSDEEGKTGEYTIAIQTTDYLLVLQYTIIEKGKSFVISENSGENKSLSTTVLNGKGTIRISNPSVMGLKVRVIDNSGAPKTFALHQNYPNPFNPVTRFTVDLPIVSDVDISIYDILGHKIVTLLNGNHEAGTVTLEWDGNDTKGFSSPSGLYFVRMTAGSFSEVRKIMLLK